MKDEEENQQIAFQNKNKKERKITFPLIQSPRLEKTKAVPGRRSEGRPGSEPQNKDSERLCVWTGRKGTGDWRSILKLQIA